MTCALPTSVSLPQIYTKRNITYSVWVRRGRGPPKHSGQRWRKYSQGRDPPESVSDANFAPSSSSLARSLPSGAGGTGAVDEPAASTPACVFSLDVNTEERRCSVAHLMAVCWAVPCCVRRVLRRRYVVHEAYTLHWTRVCGPIGPTFIGLAFAFAGVLVAEFYATCQDNYAHIAQTVRTRDRFCHFGVFVVYKDLIPMDGVAEPRSKYALHVPLALWPLERVLHVRIRRL